MKSITVTIPTLNEKGNIDNCLACLQPQLAPADEVIIIDGGSDDGTVETAKSMGAKVVEAEGSSIGEARHIGVLEADNGVIATTDADALPPEGWMDRIRNHFEDDELTVLWGNIEDLNGTPIRNLIGKFSTLVGGASGNNTAYRRSDYMELGNIYDDLNFAEDFVAIAKLALHGKAVRDPNLIMVMDMDRSRYQRKPMVAAGLLLTLAGVMTEGRFSDMAVGGGIGLAATELTYEGATDTPFHHDQVGGIMAMYGNKTGNKTVLGAGGGLIAHHMLTEGVSALPTDLQLGTDIVVEEGKQW